MFLRKIAAPSSGSYSVSKSLRFRSSASAYLNRTPASAGSQTTWTWSTWVKRGTLGIRQFITMSGINPNASQVFQVEFDANNKLSFYNQAIGVFRLTTAVYRDVGAWYHIVFVADTSNATAQSRFRVWVNGVEITVWDTNSTISSSYAFAYNGAYLHGIGAYTYSGNVFSLDGYMAEVNFIDGQALTPSSFGTYDANGVWQPIKYTGTYGTNGFYLTFGNTTSTATLGNDSSGNSNTWTVNNVSLTAGSTYDSMTDSPTVSSATVANYAVFNPLWQSRTNSPTNGNLDYAASSVGIGTIGMSSGSYYWEITSTGGTTTAALYSTTASSSIGVTIGLTYGFRFNATTGAFDYTTNGSSFTSIATGLTTGPYFPYVSTAASTTASFNAGQRPFTYTAPTGYSALNTYNLPTPTIANGAQYMAATTYTGTGATQTISDGGNNTIGTTFQPDLVWIKSRSATTNHNLFDVLRGTTAYLISNSTATEATNANTLTAFGSTGFTVGSDASAIGVNVNAATYVGWQWKANGAGVSNTNGSITSTVSANTTAGFAVVTYTGTGANATVGHGLGVAPSMIIVKSRTSAFYWRVYHVSLGNTNNVQLNTTNAQETLSTIWNNTSPTSSVFSIGTNGDVNTNTGNYVAYCWAAVPGYSAFGSYTGNGSADGPFVYANMRPRYVLIKRTDSTGDWYIWDTSRNTYNVVGEELLADTSGAGNTATDLDILSNGFKIRTTTAAINASGGTFVYAAFAENPFQNSRAR